MTHAHVCGPQSLPNLRSQLDVSHIAAPSSPITDIHSWLQCIYVGRLETEAHPWHRDATWGIFPWKELQESQHVSYDSPGNSVIKYHKDDAPAKTEHPICIALGIPMLYLEIRQRDKPDRMSKRITTYPKSVWKCAFLQLQPSSDPKPYFWSIVI